jgi:TatD DNase family protein
MMLVDSHCHLDCLNFTENSRDLSTAIEKAQQVGVGHFLCVCITQQDFQKMLATVEPYPNVSVSVGTHPNEILEDEPTIESIIELASYSRVVAIGETGLDYYRTKGDIGWQQSRFRHHIQAAKATNKPLIVHSRQARTDTIDILKEEQAEQIGGVLHCFTENWEMAQQAIAMNFYISFSGIITFQNAVELQEVVKQVPLDKILIETDSPYLAPTPFRGKSNEPAYVRYVAEKVAELKGETLEVVAQQTTDNFFKLFTRARML